MGWLAAILVGLVAGWLASLIMKGKKGFWTYLIVGIAGSLLAGLVTSIFGLNLMTDFNLTSILVGLIGSVVVIFLYRLIKK